MAKKINYAQLYTLRKDGRYQGSYRDAEGKQHFVCDRDPEKLYNKLLDVQKPKVLSFGEVAEEWHDKHWQEITIGTQANYDAPYALMLSQHKDYAFEDVTAAEVNAVLIREKAQGRSYKHAATLRSMYKQVFDYAILQKYIIYNPVATVKVPQGMKRTRREAPEDDIIKIIRNNAGEPFGLFPYLLLYTGLRLGEGLALKWEDVDFKNKTIKCNKSVDFHAPSPIIKEPKTKAGIRIIPLLSDLEKELLKQPNRNLDNFIFSGESLMTRSAFRHKWIAWCKAAGLVEEIKRIEQHKQKKIEFERTVYQPTLTAHQLRHGYATILYEAGIDELEASELMGHADITTTHKIYTHLRQKKRDDAVGKLNGYFNNLNGNLNGKIS